MEATPDQVFKKGNSIIKSRVLFSCITKIILDGERCSACTYTKKVQHKLVTKAQSDWANINVSSYSQDSLSLDSE